MLFITIEVTGPVEITRAERHQRVNLPPPIWGGVFTLYFLAVLSTRPVPQISFPVTWQSRCDVCVQVRVGSLFSLKPVRQRKRFTRSQKSSDDQEPACQASDQVCLILLSAQHPTWKSAEEVWLPGLCSLL